MRTTFKELYELLDEKSKRSLRECALRLLKEQVKKKHEFSFSGSLRSCDNDKPHPPHSTGSYSTVRWGMLTDFCLGKEGKVEIDGKKYHLRIVVEKYSSGSPETPARAYGFYYYEPIEEV